MSEHTVNNYSVHEVEREIRWHNKPYAVYEPENHRVVSRKEVPGRARAQINKLFVRKPNYLIIGKIPPLTETSHLETLTDTLTDTPKPLTDTTMNGAPPMDPRLGDKTPAYVAWFRANHSPEEFEKKYLGRKVAK